MNLFLRALRAAKIWGGDTAAAVALRPLDPEAPLPALGGAEYLPLAAEPGCGCAQPALYAHGDRVWLVCACRREGQPQEIAAAPVEKGAPGKFAVLVRQSDDLEFPQAFFWQGRHWLLAGCGGKPKLFCCTDFAGTWQEAPLPDFGGPLWDVTMEETGERSLILLGSEPEPQTANSQGEARARRRRFVLALQGAGPEEGFTLTPDEAFSAVHSDFVPLGRAAGADFALGGQRVRAVRRGDYLQFYAARPAGEAPLCAAEPRLLNLRGMERGQIKRVTGYSRSAELEAVAVEYYPQ